MSCENALAVILCIFAVFGFYCLLRDLCFCFCAKRKFRAAVRAEECVDLFDAVERLKYAEWLSYHERYIEMFPIIICDDELLVDEMKKSGYRVYLKQN